MLIELLFLINLNKTPILSKCTKLHSSTSSSTPPLLLANNNNKKICELSNEHFWPTSEYIWYYFYTCLYIYLYTYISIPSCPLWHIIWWWDWPFNFSIIMQLMISNNERAVWLLTGKSGHEAILAHLQRFLNERVPLALHLPGAG